MFTHCAVMSAISSASAYAQTGRSFQAPRRVGDRLGNCGMSQREACLALDLWRDLVGCGIRSIYGFGITNGSVGTVLYCAAGRSSRRRETKTAHCHRQPGEPPDRYYRDYRDLRRRCNGTRLNPRRPLRGTKDQKCLTTIGCENTVDTRVPHIRRVPVGKTMPVSISISDDVYALLASLARPFVDKEPADVVRRLVLKEAGSGNESVSDTPVPSVMTRLPRQRGAVVELDGHVVRADTVPELFKQVMEYLYANGHWSKVRAMAPYKTSAQRYLFSQTPKHPNGNDFFVGLQCRDLYVEAHKNYRVSIQQLTRFLRKCGVQMTYMGSYT